MSLVKSKKKYKPKKSIKIASENSRTYFNLNIQIYNNEAIISIFDPYKNSQDINYIIPQSSAICLVNPKSLWINNGCIGINWVLVQAKIFQPIIKLEQCLIIDEFEESPLKHYHYKVDNDSESQISDTPEDQEFEEKYAKFIKMKKMGVPFGAIEIEFKKHPELSISEFKNHFGIKDEKLPEYKPKPKITIQPKSNKMQSGSGHTTSAFRPPTANELQNVLKKLKPIQ
tara:strand:- start:43 stop:726 length:684 start_codon:yes stop_codon:yes gene_type:complete